MRTITKKGRREEAQISLSINTAKAVACIKRFKETGEIKWLDLGIEQIKSANKYLKTLDAFNGNWVDELLDGIRHE